MVPADPETSGPLLAPASKVSNPTELFQPERTAEAGGSAVLGDHPPEAPGERADLGAGELGLE